MAEDTSVEESNARKGEDNYQTLFNNSKMTYDKMFELIALGGQQLNNVALQALQNAVETANLVGKQAVNNADLTAKGAINAQAISNNKMWNLEVTEAASEAGVLRAAGLDGVTYASIQGAVAAAVSKALLDAGLAVPTTTAAPAATSKRRNK